MYLTKKRQTFAKLKEDYELYLFLIVPMLLIFLFHYIPMVGIVLSFEDYSISGGVLGSRWVGLWQFKRFFSSYDFDRIIYNTISLSFYGLVASFPIPIVFALLLNAIPMQRYRKVIQTVTYMPHFISTVVIVGVLFQIFNARIGVYGIIGKRLTGSMPPDILAEPEAFRHLYVWSGVWKSTGWNSIIYFAALSSVDKELHEAAEIDGATRFQRMLHIDLPCILPTASIMLIMAAGGIMSVGFEKVYLMQNNMNISTSEVISTYVYKVGLVSGGGDFSFGSAIGIFNSVTNFALMMFVNFICKKLGGSSLW